MAKRVFSVQINASPKYPVWRRYQEEANGIATAISRAVKKYLKEAKSMKLGRITFCQVRADIVGQAGKMVKEPE